MPIDITAILARNYGAEENFPEWTKPFLSAVKKLDKPIEEDIGGMLGEGPEVAAGQGGRTDVDRIEEELLSAVELSSEEEPLPLEWLVSFYMDTEQWTKAREASLKAFNRKAVQSSPAANLSICYEKEEDYIKAYEWLQTAASLLHPIERERHRKRLANLQQRSDDMQAERERLAEQERRQLESANETAEPVAVDPFLKLPLELIVLIMRFGLRSNRHFVLRASWVSRTWNQTLVHNCPELWGYFKLPWKELKTKERQAKHTAWIDRSGGKFRMIDIPDLTTFSGVVKVPKAWTPYMATAQRLRLRVGDHGVLGRFCDRFRAKFGSLVELNVDAGRIRYGPSPEEFSQSVMHCGLLSSTALESIEALIIQNVNFSDQDNPNRDTDEYFKGRYSLAPLTAEQYPQLRQLSVVTCDIDVFEADLEETGDRSVVGRHTSCVLHRTLLGTPKLQQLTVHCDPNMTDENARRQRLSRKRIIMPNLSTIAIPPPVVWAIDISSPVVNSLRFVLPDGYSKSEYEHRPDESRLPLIPEICDSPVNTEQLARLIHLGLLVSSADTVAGLEAWLSCVSSLKQLSLHTTRQPAREPNAMWQPMRIIGERSYICVGQVLHDHPNWAPNMTELHLLNCDVPGERLVEYVKLRIESPTVSALQKLVIKSRNSSEERGTEAMVWLQNAIPQGLELGYYSDRW